MDLDGKSTFQNHLNRDEQLDIDISFLVAVLVRLVTDTQALPFTANCNFIFGLKSLLCGLIEDQALKKKSKKSEQAPPE